MQHVFFPFAEWSAERGFLLPRIICLPWAGGTAAVFRSWLRPFRDVAQVLAVEYPGHGARYGERCFHDAARLAAAIADGVSSLPRPDTPVMIYGHSMGALVGFELARRLAAASASLIGLVMSGYHAPHWRHERTLRSKMTDTELVADMRSIGGTMPEILESPDLLSVVLPILRADYHLAENYHPSLADLQPKLSLPVQIVGGDNDPSTPIEGLEAWRQILAGDVNVAVWPGDHFFIDAHQPALVKLVSRRLQEWSAPPRKQVMS